jgi:1-acyl-sn-glycerol-3-phosphate acyltransferase
LKKKIKKKIPYLTSTAPAKWKLKIYRIFYFFFGWIGRILIANSFDHIEVKGTEHLKGGPKLLLMNHSCPLDPVIITFFGRQPLQFLVTEAFMQGSLGSKVASAFGQITKRKLDFDMTSIRLMKEWCDCGGIVATFPEGQFSWDGEESPLMPGIEQLISYLNVPVVTVSLENGNRVKPAWALSSRKTKVKIIINEPITFKKTDPIEDIISTQIFNRTGNPFRADSYGVNLSAGLVKALRYCPSCADEKGLIESKNELICHLCDESWILTANNKVKGKDIKDTKELFESLYQQIDVKWQELKKYTSVGPVELIDVTKALWNPKLKGTLTLDEEKININDFQVLYKDIQSHTLDWGDHIIIKTRMDRYAIKLPSDSRAIITHILDKEVS